LLIYLLIIKVQILCETICQTNQDYKLIHMISGRLRAFLKIAVNLEWRAQEPPKTLQ